MSISARSQPGLPARIGFLSNASSTTGKPHVDAFRRGLRELGWSEGKLVHIEYRWANGNPDLLVGLARELVDSKVDVLVVSGLGAMADDGGLMSYGPNLIELYGRSASYVDRILKGANPAELAIERPARFELVINRKAAAGLGLTIPKALLLQADEIIQ